MKKMTFDDLWDLKSNVWHFYNTTFGVQPYINNPHIDWFDRNVHSFESLDKTFECIRNSELESIDLNTEKGLELFSTYSYLLCFMYFIYYALSLKIAPNTYKNEMTICVDKIRNHLKLINNGESMSYLSVHGCLLRIYSPFGVNNLKNKEKPLFFKADPWINKRLHDYQNFIKGVEYNDEFTPFHLWALSRFNCYDWENCWLQGGFGGKEKETFFALAQYCAYARTPQKLYQNINNFIIKDFLNAPFDNREYVVYSLKTKPIKMDKGKLWTTIESTYSIIKILDLDLIFRNPKDYKKEDIVNSFDFNKKETKTLVFYKAYPAIIRAIKELVSYASGLCYSSDKIQKPQKIEDYFETIFKLPQSILNKYPALYRVLYLTIQHIDYNKFKKIFQYETNAPIPFNELDKDNQVYRSDELEKLSAKDFIDKDSDLEKILKLLNICFSLFHKKNPSFSETINFANLKTAAFSKTETAIFLLHNITSYIYQGKIEFIKQQVNFCGEQRDRLFDYHSVKSSWNSAKNKNRKQLNKDEYLYYLANNKSAFLDSQQTKMNEIDCGISIKLDQKWPSFGKSTYISRNIHIKLFPETDIYCKIPKDELYAQKRNFFTQNKYIYHERNIDTHFIRFNNTEELLNTKNYKDLVEFLYKTRQNLYNQEILCKHSEELENLCKEFRVSPWLSLFGNDFSSQKNTLAPNENYKLVVKALKSIEEKTKTLKNQYANKVLSAIDEDDIKRILHALNNVTGLEFNYYHFFSKLEKKDELKKGLSDLNKQLVESLNTNKMEPFISEDDIDYKKFVLFLNSTKQEAIEEYNNIVGIIKQNEMSDEPKCEELHKKLWKLSDIIHNIENKVDFYDKLANLPHFKKRLKEHVLQLIDEEFSESLVKKYIELCKQKKWRETRELLNLRQIIHIQRMLDSNIFDEKMINNINQYHNYCLSQEILSLIKEMEGIANKKFDTEELQNVLDNNDYNKFTILIKKIVEDVQQSKFIHTNKKSELHLDPFFDLSSEEKEKVQERYLKQELDYIQELAKYKKWDKLKIVARHLEYDIIPNCEQKEFLLQCSELLSTLPQIEDASAKEFLCLLQKSAQISLDNLSRKEISKDIWSTIEEVKDFDNPILKKTQNLFFQLLYLIAYKQENITRCFEDIKAQNKDSFIESNGRITITRASLENMMDECKYSDVLTKDLREYLNTLFCVSHICDNKNQEVNFFDLYGDQVMSYLINVTLKLASLPSQKIADQAN